MEVAPCCGRADLRAKAHAAGPLRSPRCSLAAAMAVPISLVDSDVNPGRLRLRTNRLGWYGPFSGRRMVVCPKRHYFATAGCRSLSNDGFCGCERDITNTVTLERADGASAGLWAHGRRTHQLAFRHHDGDVVRSHAATRGGRAGFGTDQADHGGAGSGSTPRSTRTTALGLDLTGITPVMVMSPMVEVVRGWMSFVIQASTTPSSIDRHSPFGSAIGGDAI